jgi:hypothetical protein
VPLDCCALWCAGALELVLEVPHELIHIWSISQESEKKINAASIGKLNWSRLSRAGITAECCAETKS